MGKEESKIPIVQATPVPVEVVAGEKTNLLNVGGGGGYQDSSPMRPDRTWKDGLFSCFKFGPCHPSVLNAWLCPQILMAQVLTRMRLNMFGNPAPEHVYKSTFKNVVILVITYYIFSSIFGCPPAEVEISDNGFDDDHPQQEVTIIDECPDWKRCLGHLVSMAFGLYTLVVMIKARAAVRHRFGIPTQSTFGFMEDCCCAFWCGCCTISQLARQTADYDVDDGICCSSDGLRPGVSDTVLIV
jgi:Cys-rich protein (TIGR01571 family)